MKNEGLKFRDEGLGMEAQGLGLRIYKEKGLGPRCLSALPPPMESHTDKQMKVETVAAVI